MPGVNPAGPGDEGELSSLREERERSFGTWRGSEQSPKLAPVPSVETVRSAGSPRSSPSSLAAELQGLARLGCAVLLDGDPVPGARGVLHPVVADDLGPAGLLELARLAREASRSRLEAPTFFLLRHRDRGLLAGETGAPGEGKADGARRDPKRESTPAAAFGQSGCQSMDNRAGTGTVSHPSRPLTGRFISPLVARPWLADLAQGLPF